ncbi:MAG: hypothetical protein K0S29_1212 [Gammaproteobacteria bacterium]|nr:hypothetical protein [Gammaproteobacteria bacterium]
MVSNGDAKDQVYAAVHAELVKGFNKGGQAQFSVQDINDFYFDAYHDPNSADQGYAVFALYNHNATITCVPGTDNRPLVPGYYLNRPANYHG